MRWARCAGSLGAVMPPDSNPNNGCLPSSLPHALQNRLPSGMRAPQCVHCEWPSVPQLLQAPSAVKSPPQATHFAALLMALPLRSEDELTGSPLVDQVLLKD